MFYTDFHIISIGFKRSPISAPTSLPQD